MQDNQAEIEKRKIILEAEIKEYIKWRGGGANLLDKAYQILYYASYICSGLAVISSFIPKSEKWQIGIVSVVSTVLVSVARSANLRERSFWGYRYEDYMKSLLRKLRVSGPIPITGEYISEIAKDMDSFVDKMTREAQPLATFTGKKQTPPHPHSPQAQDTSEPSGGDL